MSNTLLLHCLILFLILSGPQTLPHDGVHHRSNRSTVAYLTLSWPMLAAAEAESSCEETYGFLPCTHSVLGNLFLILVYGYLMYLAATYLPNGSELLLEILGSGIVGGFFLPVLGSLPTPFSFSVNISDFSLMHYLFGFGRESLVKKVKEKPRITFKGEEA